MGGGAGANESQPRNGVGDCYPAATAGLWAGGKGELPAPDAVGGVGSAAALGRPRNQRSLLYLGNLVDMIITCIDHPAAANETFLVSDGEDLSTTDLIRRLARALGRPARLIPVPAAVLMAGATLLGKREVAAAAVRFASGGYHQGARTVGLVAADYYG